MAEVHEIEKPLPTLHYSSIRGIAQPIRNLFYYLQVEFNEVVVESNRDSEAGFNSGFPRFFHEDFDITDVMAIARHICRYYSRNDLLGLTPQNRATINEFMFHYADVRAKVIKIIFEGAKRAWGKNEGEIYEIKVGVAKEIIEEECALINVSLSNFDKNKTFLLGYLTIMDFFFYEICFYLLNFLGPVLENHLLYRKIQLFLLKFESQPFFINNQEIIKSRKIFVPFKEKLNESIIRAFWKGDPSILS